MSCLQFFQGENEWIHWGQFFNPPCPCSRVQGRAQLTDNNLFEKTTYFHIVNLPNVRKHRWDDEARILQDKQPTYVLGTLGRRNDNSSAH